MAFGNILGQTPNIVFEQNNIDFSNSYVLIGNKNIVLNKNTISPITTPVQIYNFNSSVFAIVFIEDIAITNNYKQLGKTSGRIMIPSSSSINSLSMTRYYTQQDNSGNITGGRSSIALQATNSYLNISLYNTIYNISDYYCNINVSFFSNQS